MNLGLEWRFSVCMYRRRPMFWDEMIMLYPRDLFRNDKELGTVLTFDIVERETDQISGEISLRMGDSEAQFYLGHIGYHIDPPFRGKHEALRACRLCLPMMKAYGHNSFVITTDVNNYPSIRTCEHLACEMESIVTVPEIYRKQYKLSKQKKRFVFVFSEIQNR